MQDDTQPKDAVRTVAVIGAGTLGRTLALMCARAGFDVVLEDVLPSRLRNAQEGLQQLLAGEAETLAGSLTFASSVEDAVREADIAIDFVPDELESKLEIFWLMDRMAPPKTILCCPSDALSITDIGSCTYRADKCVAVRVAGKNAGGDATILPEATAVRLLHSAKTSQETLDTVAAFWQRLGKAVNIEDDPDAPVLMHNAHVGAPSTLL
ncbi:MAG: 3-hydroxyacyl-CoA dehydrogenase NAD-binding domain-containing protein [Acidobacteriaceae bacterium]